MELERLENNFLRTLAKCARPIPDNIQQESINAVE
jgi:hypothetical protein